MKAYLVITGTMFGLLAIMHLIQAIHEIPALTTDPKYVLGMAALGVVAAGMSAWAWRLLKSQAR